MKFKKLLTDHVLVELEPARERTGGGIIIPGTVAEPVRVGRVLMVGPGRKFKDRFVPTTVQEGERVCFFIASADTKSGKSVSYHLEESQRLMREQDILGVLVEGVEVSL
jgi:chaperonin GroES